MQHNFHFLMRDLSLEVDQGRLSEAEAVAQVARSIQRALGCTRVNFWNVTGGPGARRMLRMAGYDGVAQRTLSDPLELRETHGRFFGILYEKGCYVCPDTAQDDNLSEIYPSYLRPTDAHTMIVAAFYLDETVWGLISCVHNQPRRWTAGEITALRKCASELSRQRARRGRT